MDFPRLSIFSFLSTPSFASTTVPSLQLNTQVSLYKVRKREVRVRQKKNNKRNGRSEGEKEAGGRRNKKGRKEGRGSNVQPGD